LNYGRNHIFQHFAEPRIFVEVACARFVPSAGHITIPESRIPGTTIRLS